jgi:hypothetical protein
VGDDRNVIITAVPGPKVEVGVNYAWPWNKIGVYYGSGEHHPGENPDYDIWTANLARNLDLLRPFGVTVVRLFLFGNAYNYGTLTPLPPAWDPLAYNWKFDPPTSLHPNYTKQLELMLLAFESRKMQVIPSLLSFEALAAWRSVGGRSELIRDPAVRDQFFKVALDPILDISSRHSGAIRAWEVINEPGQLIKNSLPSMLGHVMTDYPVDESVMRDFLRRALDRIEAKGFVSTVGHWREADLKLDNCKLPQFHYYPTKVMGLPLVGDLPLCKDVGGAFIGEFAASRVQSGQSHSVPWPEIPADVQQDGRKRTFARLKKIEEKGYKLALLWPDTGTNYDPANPAHDDLHFTPEVLQGVKDYLTS